MHEASIVEQTSMQQRNEVLIRSAAAPNIESGSGDENRRASREGKPLSRRTGCYGSEGKCACGTRPGVEVSF
jgi:hypothetical protein